MNIHEYINKVKNFKVIKWTGLTDNQINELISKTDYLEHDSSVPQRLYHLLHKIPHKELCNCGKSKKFSGRLSISDIKKSEALRSNYYDTCGDGKCRLKIEISALNKIECAISKIKKDIELNKALLELTYYLDSNYEIISIQQRLYHLIFNEGIKYCNCGNPLQFNIRNRLNAIQKNKYNYNSTCGSEFCHSLYCKENTAKILTKKYGVPNVADQQWVKDKVIKTNLERYGVKYATQIPGFQEKMEITCFKKYGVKHHTKLKSVQEKKEQTNLKRYGVKNPLQATNIFIKNQMSGFRYKDYVLPSGTVIKVQGYENWALDILVLQFEESDIITEHNEICNEIGRLKYIAEDEVERRYYPDIYIKSLNKLIEVKSEYTLNWFHQRNMCKAARCKELGINHEFWVFDNQQNLRIIT